MVGELRQRAGMHSEHSRFRRDTLTAVCDDYESKLLRSTRTFLARWQGASARVRPHGPSHAYLQIVLSREAGSKSENLTIAVHPVWWHGFFEWDDARLSIELVETALSRAAGRSRRERLFGITDANGEFECLTESLEVKERRGL
jgi:hypothetical protein